MSTMGTIIAGIIDVIVIVRLSELWQKAISRDAVRKASATSG